MGLRGLSSTMESDVPCGCSLVPKLHHTARAEAAVGTPFRITTFQDPLQKRLCVQSFDLAVPMCFYSL